LVLDEPQDNEISIPVNGVDVLIGDEVKDLANKSRIDYMTGPNGEGFVISLAGSPGC
jgi:hypothetical protein